MNSIILGGLLISDPFELIKVEALLFVQQLKFFPDSTLFIFKHSHLKLVDLFLLILINIIILWFLKIKLRGFVQDQGTTRRVRQLRRRSRGHPRTGTWESICRDCREAILLLFKLASILFQPFNLILFILDFFKFSMQFLIPIALFPDLHEFSTLPLIC